MSVNLLDLAKSTIGSGALSSLSKSFGANEEATGKAFDLASSAILGGLIKKASDPRGATDVFDQVKNFDSGGFGLDDIVDIFKGGAPEEKQSSLSSMGWDLVSGLFGSSKLDSIIEMLSRLTGIGQGSSKSLLSMVAPLLMGTLAKQVKSGGLDLSDFTSMIMGQKSQVSRNLPASFSQELGIANLLDEGAQTVQRTANEAAETGAGFLKALVPLALILGLGFLIWKMTQSDAAKEVAEEAKSAAVAAEQAVEDAADRIAVNKPAVPELNLDSIKTELSDSFGSLTESVLGITDQASAEKIVPQIEEVTKQITGYGFDKMPEQSLSGLQGINEPLVEKLKAALETVSQVPGVKEVLEPALGSLMDSVSAYTKS